MYTTLCKGTLGQKERNILQTSDVRLSAGLIHKFLVLFLKLIMVATMLTIKHNNTTNHAILVNTFWTNFFYYNLLYMPNK